MSGDGFTVPIEDRYFEDYAVGSVHEFGAIAVEEAEVIAFARRFDPQTFHIDPETARTTAFGGLIASGWHTGSLTMRLLVDHYISHVASLGSPGIDELRWLRPVRPGDTLSARVTVTEARPSRSKPDRGIVRSFVEALNGDREVVMTLSALTLILRRPARPGPQPPRLM